MDVCSSCNGSGMTKKSTIETCPHCGGSGTLFSQQGMMQTITTCHYCNGQGKTIINPCKKCNGNGIAPITKTTEIEIPKGVGNGMQMVLEGQGSVPMTRNGKGVNGDLLIVIQEKPHAKFVRNGNDLLFDINLNVLDAITGCEIQVNTIDKKKLAAKIPQGVEDGMNFRFSGNGMPIYGTNQFGSMIGVIRHTMPKKLNEEELNLINELKTKENFKTK